MGRGWYFEAGWREVISGVWCGNLCMTLIISIILNPGDSKKLKQTNTKCLLLERTLNQHPLIICKPGTMEMSLGCQNSKLLPCSSSNTTKAVNRQSWQDPSEEPQGCENFSIWINPVMVSYPTFFTSCDRKKEYRQNMLLQMPLQLLLVIKKWK